MLRVLFSAIAMLTVHTIFAQNIDVDKNNGLVKVDGKEAFYLIKTNKTFLNYDVSLQNLDKQELVYFSQKSVEQLPYHLRSAHTAGTYFFATFPETANTAYVFPNSFSGLKSLAKQIVAANLIKDQQIDSKSERAFVVSHDGDIVKEPETILVNVNTNGTSPTTTTSKSTNIIVKANSIYNNDELIGSFKQSIKDSTATINIYNTGDIKIAMATHNEADANADWNVMTTVDNKSYQFLYNSATPLEKLFKALVDKGLL